MDKEITSPTIVSSEDFIKRAIKIVKDYTEEHLDKSDADIPEVKPFVTWYSKELKNHKALLSTNIHDGMYYELTYNGEKNEIYFDAYKKFENKKIEVE